MPYEEDSGIPAAVLRSVSGDTEARYPAVQGLLVNDAIPGPDELICAGHEQNTVGPENTVTVAQGKRWTLRWARFVNEPGPCDRRGAAVVMAFLSDYALVTVMKQPLEAEGYSFDKSIGASLGHVMHFHRPFDPTQWLLVYTEANATEPHQPAWSRRARE